MKVVNAIRYGRIKPVLSSAIVDEYTEVLSRDKYQFDQNDARQMIDAIVAQAVFLDPQPSGETFADETDRVFYEVALAGQDDATRLVTGNLRHYPITPIVVTPAQMVAILESTRS